MILKESGLRLVFRTTRLFYSMRWARWVAVFVDACCGPRHSIYAALDTPFHFFKLRNPQTQLKEAECSR